MSRDIRIVSKLNLSLCMTFTLFLNIDKKTCQLNLQSKFFRYNRKLRGLVFFSWSQSVTVNLFHVRHSVNYDNDDDDDDNDDDDNDDDDVGKNSTYESFFKSNSHEVQTNKFHSLSSSLTDFFFMALQPLVSLLRLHDHTHLDTLCEGDLFGERSVRCRDFSRQHTTLPTDNMPPLGFEHAIPLSERPQTHDSDRAATGILPPRLRRRILSRNVIRLLCRKNNYKHYDSFQRFGSVRAA
jgi:hypothetical protein